MQRYLQICGAVLWLLGSSAFLLAQDKPPENKAAASVPVTGELKLGEKSFKLAHIVAYETKFNDDTVINILLSDRKLPLNDIKAALAKEDDQSFLLDQPYLKIVFRKSGEPRWFDAAAGGTTIGGSDDGLGGELKLAAGRVQGQAKVEPVGEGALQRSFEVKFDVALGVDQAPKPVRPAGPVKPTVTGTFKGNGKEAKLAFVSAREGDPFDDKPSIVLVLTEKDHSKDKKPDFKAGFGDYYPINRRLTGIVSLV